MCSVTSLHTWSGNMSGTSRIENFPITFLGITVFPPAPLNAPSIPEEQKSNQSLDYMSRIMRKPAFCICKNKGADQLRGPALLGLAALKFVVEKLATLLNELHSILTCLAPTPLKSIFIIKKQCLSTLIMKMWADNGIGKFLEDSYTTVCTRLTKSRS